MKCMPKHVDKVDANDFIYNPFVPDTKRSHNNFKVFSDQQKHLIKPPTKRKFTN